MKLSSPPRFSAHLFSACTAGLAFASLNPPAHAADYLKTSSLSNKCETIYSKGCVDVVSSMEFNLYGNENTHNSQSTTGFTGQASTYVASFSWAFTRESGMTAFYSINGSQTPLDGVLGSASFTVQAGETLEFGVNTGPSDVVPILEISNFSTVSSDPAPVPAPLPVLGSAFALSSFRRLRRQSKRLRLASARPSN